MTASDSTKGSPRLGEMLGAGKHLFKGWSSGTTTAALPCGKASLVGGRRLFERSLLSVMATVSRLFGGLSSAFRVSFGLTLTFAMGLTVILGAPVMVAPAVAGIADCQVPTGVRLSKCIGSGNAVTIGGVSGTGSCKGEEPNNLNVNAYVDSSSLPALGKITITAGSSLTVFDTTSQLPLPVKTNGIEVLGTLQVGTPLCPIGTTNPKTRVTFTFTGERDPN